jgi:hypothetical protein
LPSQNPGALAAHGYGLLLLGLPPAQALAQGFEIGAHGLNHWCKNAFT